MRDVLDRIRTLVRARYPVLQLVTHEEQRVERSLGRLSTDEDRPLYTWRATSGLSGPDGPIDGTIEVAHALGALMEVEEPAFFVLIDLAQWWGDPEVLRLLRDLAGIVGPRQQTVFMVGIDAMVPAALEKEVTVIDIPLPGREDVGKLLAALLKAQKIDVPTDRFWRFVDGCLGLTEREIKRLLARIMMASGGFSEADLAALVEEKRQVIRRSRYLEFWEGGGSVAHVGGMDSLKDWLERRGRGFSDDARQFGLPQPKGLFLLGVQGCGKSLMAKAVADLWKMPLLRLDVAAVFSGARSEDESLRATIRIAERLAPVVLWIDELEKGFMSMSEQGGGQSFGTFLTWMQEKQSPVFVVATANDVRALPPELMRKGRFDDIFFVDLPDVHERLQILEIHLKIRDRDPHAFDLTQVAEETERFSGAELEQVVVSALFQAFSDQRTLCFEDLVEAARDTVPLAVTMDDHIKQLREWARPRARRASTDRHRVDFFEHWEEAE
ncbi:MAG: AAA family ATPase [Myxococcota bacterium]|nr:AAA family ATPase [Myxococcota bacterium]